jgi:hypothetical protein
MNADYYKNLRKILYRVHLLSLGFYYDQSKYKIFKDKYYDIAKKQNEEGDLAYIEAL